LTPVVWTFAALADLEGIRRYIGNFNPYAAQDMAARIIEAGNSLANFPYRGRSVPGTQLRETTLARPYIIRYRVEPNRVLILRVRHGTRRPTRP
jgi:toxin ParE1/3/4